MSDFERDDEDGRRRHRKPSLDRTLAKEEYAGNQKARRSGASSQAARSAGVDGNGQTDV